jgi:hypothetical protein
VAQSGASVWTFLLDQSHQTPPCKFTVAPPDERVP